MNEFQSLGYANHGFRAHKTVCENRYAVWILVKISICLPWYLLYGSCRYPRVLYSSIATRRRDPRARRQISILPCGPTLFLLWRYRRCHILVPLKICCIWKKKSTNALEKYLWPVTTPVPFPHSRLFRFFDGRFFDFGGSNSVSGFEMLTLSCSPAAASSIDQVW